MGRRAGGTGGANRGGATAHGTRRRERMERMERRGRVGNPPYRTTEARRRAQGDDTRRAQGGCVIIHLLEY